MACNFLWKFISETFHCIFLKVKKSIDPFNSPSSENTFSFLSEEVVNMIEFYFINRIWSTVSACAVKRSVLAKQLKTIT